MVTHNQMVLSQHQMKREEKAIQEAIESCKSEIYAEYEERLSELRKRNEEERRIWKAEALEMALRKEQEMKAKMEALTSQNYKEKKELERLTRVAANAFKSGSESVDLLRDQVAKQRLEMEETRRKHQKEVEELKALLEVKRRKGRGGHGELRNAGGSLEDSAEFEYLRNILYQYMIGKETQVKCLNACQRFSCAVVKFNKEQQRQIIDHEGPKTKSRKYIGAPFDSGGRDWGGTGEGNEGIFPKIALSQRVVRCSRVPEASISIANLKKKMIIIKKKFRLKYLPKVGGNKEY
ncbi:hypothetical protein Avbf_10970 [Armadillidium vulgare]|nr:hypothetical protein Avbf_10970 [Armadillidium vulgare]